MLTLQQLRCLAALSETLHFHRAAERCHISQPALSNQIAQLEEELGVMLVERSRRRVLLTTVGRDIADRAKAILRDVEDLRLAARQGSGPLSGTLRLGVLPTLGPYLLPHILPRLRQAYPELRLYLREEPKARLVPELVLGELDVLLMSPPDNGDGLTVAPLFREPFWLALPLDHPLVTARSLGPGQLAGQRLMLMDAGHCLRDQGLALCRDHGAAEDPDFRATSLDSLRQMVATGLGATLLPGLYVEAEAREDDQIRVLPFADPAPSRAISLVWRRTSTRAADFRQLAELIRDSLPPAVEAVR